LNCLYINFRFRTNTGRHPAE